MNELVSVIIPIYNAEKYLKTCVESVLNQTYKNLEIILVDDGSLDFSGKMCDDYAKEDSRVVVLHKPNGGVSNARNAGLDIMTGDYVTFVDSDDYIDIHMVECLMNDIKQYDADMAQCQVYTIDKCGVTTRNTSNEVKVYSAEDALPKHLNEGEGIVTVWAKVYKRHLFKDVRFDETLHFSEDLVITIECLICAKRIVIDTRGLYYYNMHDNSAVTKSFNEYTMDAITSAERVLRIVESEYPQHIKGALFRYDFSYFQVLDRIMLDDKWRKNKYLNGILKHFRNNIFRIFSYPNLPKKRKLVAIIACVCPPLYRRIVMAVWKKKYS